MPALDILSELRRVLGGDAVLPRAQIQQHRHADWSGLPAQAPLALLRPRDTPQVSAALAICNRHGQPVVTQGGLTGLAGGACTTAGDIALSLARMDAIEEIDPLSATMTVQAGAPLETVQQAAARAGLLFPLDLGARGSCTLGGNLATNAGGNRVIRYGMARDQVLGLEAVLADGSVLDGTRKMVKDNTGYDLRHLMIGSEGTLGVITRAVLRLRPRPQAVATAYCGLSGYDAVTRLLAELRAPLSSRHAFYVLLESEGADSAGHQAAFEQFMGAMLDAGVIENAAIAQSTSDATAFWRVRDATAEFPMLLPDLVAFDVSFAIADIGLAAQRCDAALRQAWPASTVLAYGHLGDGNLHLIAGARRTGHRPGRAGRCRRGHGLRHRARASRLSVGRTRHRRQEARRPRPYPQPGRVGRHAGHQGRAGSSRHPQPRQAAARDAAARPTLGASTC